MGLEEFSSLRDKITAKRVLVQLPAGLMPHAEQIKQALKGKEVFFSSHLCFGACDIDSWAAEKIGAGAIINVGHSEVSHKSPIPVYFVEWRGRFDSEIETKGLPKVIGLVTTVQFVHEVERVKDRLEKVGKKVLVGAPGEMCKYFGQVTGCDISSATSISDNVDGFVFIGNSQFHALKIAVDTQKPVWMLEDGKLNKVSDDEVKAELKRRAGRKALAYNHQKYGILVSTKMGQFNLDVAKKIRDKLEKREKKVLLIVGDVFRADELMNFDVDAFVTTACPRLVDDWEVFGKLVYSTDDF